MLRNLIVLSMLAVPVHAQDTTAVGRDTTVTPAPQQLEPVVVSASSREGSLYLRGFYLRRQRSGGYFLDREEIERYEGMRFTDMLRARVPSVQIHSQGLGMARLRLRGQRCAPMVWLDGAPTPAGEFDLDVLEPFNVAAVEVYPGAATAPVEFRTAYGRDACGGIIVVWSRLGPEEGDQPEVDPFTADLLAPPVPVYHAGEVDVPAAIDSTALVAPIYPDSLFAFSVPGNVVAELVVDTTGAPVAGSIRIVSGSHAAFGEAVRRALAVSRFRPARDGGRLVRQVLRVPYRFTTEAP